MFDSIWRADGPRDVFDNVALGLIIIFVPIVALIVTVAIVTVFGWRRRRNARNTNRRINRLK